jgi:O-antigen ligase
VSESTPQQPPAEPRFGKWLGAMWLYTLLRFGLFLALWGILVLFGVRGLLGALIALVLSVPLSFVLLARPRAAFAAQLEARVSARRVDRAHLDAELDPDSPARDE